MKELTIRPVMGLGSFFGGVASPYISALGGYVWAASQPFALYPGQRLLYALSRRVRGTRAVTMLRRREKAEPPPRI
jgi:hypothetical protein